MPGILDYDKILDGFGPYSTSTYREKLLLRNLPPPVNETLIAGGLANSLQDIGTIINVPIFGVTSENIPIHYDEDKRLFPLGEIYRDTKNVNLNKFAPLNDEYVLFDITIPPNLGYPVPEWGGDVVRNPYPTAYNLERFQLINSGDKSGVPFPFNVIDTYKQLNLQKETTLGLVGGELLEKDIIDKIAHVQQRVDDKDNVIESITPPIGADGGVNIYVDRLRGNVQWFNSLPDGAVGWQEYNSNSKNQEQLAKISTALGGYSEPAISTEQRVNTLLTHTSLSQVKFLFDSLTENLFIPSYEDRRLIGTSYEGTNSRYYIGSERSTNRGATISQVFQSVEFNEDASTTDPDSLQSTTIDEKFFWTTGNQTPFNDKTLLDKTQKLLDEHPDGVWINQTKKYFKDRTEDRLISRGSAMSKLSFIEAAFNGAFCRVWTVSDQYNYLKAMRNTGLFSSPDVTLPGFSVSSENASLSVLGDNGIVKTHPTKEDAETTFKKYMFSLENLAWTDNLADLPLSEIGGGDILSGTKGRIMWFPPYELSFDENISANWTKSDFIGRGEPVFTYNNSTRSGQLRFKILVDHPKVINGYRGKRTDAIEKFFAGCISPTTFLEFLDKNSGISQLTKDEVDVKINDIKKQKATVQQKVAPQTKTVKFKFDEANWEDATDGAAIEAWAKGEGKKLVGEAVSTNSKLILRCDGYAGFDEDKFKEIAKKRAQNTYATVLQFLGSPKVKRIVKGHGKKDSSTTLLDPNNSRVEITLEADLLGDPAAEYKPEGGLGDIAFYPEEAQLIDNLIIDETKYFEFIDGNYPTYFQTISEKIKYFHPGYHSTTPEGLNTRLTFLHQCMRQGPSVNNKQAEIQPQNLAFGRPPICILRIGDFFNTKIVINSLSISYAAGGSVPQWDLNPEGIGVQPMIADVTLSIDLIGGHSLVGPINKLQNALSFNYYANTEMYDPRADGIDKSKGKIKPGIKLGKLKQKALGGDEALKKLEESLKKEGIIEEEEESTKAGDNTQTDSKSGLDISVNNIEKTTYQPIPLAPIVTFESSEIKIVSTKKPSEVDFNGETDPNNLINVEIKVERKGIGFKTTVKNQISEKIKTYKGNEWGKGITLISPELLKKAEDQLTEYEGTLKTLENELLNYSGSSTPIPELLVKINTAKSNIKSSEKEVEKLKKGSDKIKVEVYYTKDKKGSKKTKQFTYGSAGLT